MADTRDDTEEISIADTLNWNEEWERRYIRHLATVSSKDCGEYWKNPRNVQRVIKRGTFPARQASHQLKQIEIPESASVLDIGSGTGTLAIPLAKRGCSVTAVEPSKAMIDSMLRCQSKLKSPDIKTINKSWEDISPDELETYDVVIASYSLTMKDIADAVRKMDLVSRGSVYLFWYLTPPAWAQIMQNLWPRVYGSPYYFKPTADVLFQVLLQQKIFPNMEVEIGSHSPVYSALGEAADDFCARMNCKDDRARRIITDYLRQHMKWDEKGWELRGDSWNARIWWKKGLAPVPRY
jgi:SAM-dependent methyltransferase